MAIASSVKLAFTFGMRRSVIATALMIRSFTERRNALGPSFGDLAFSSSRSFSSASISISIET